MSLQDWGAVGDLVGGIGVVVSLIYVAVQIRQNTSQLAQTLELNRLASFERSVDAGNRIREVLILNPDLATLFVRGSRSFRELESADRLRFDFLIRNMFSSFQGAFARQRVIGHDPEQFAGTERVMARLLRNPGVLEWLDKSERDWSPDFSALVDRLAQAARKALDSASP